MIKIIAFDFVGVLVKEKNIELTDIENKLEKMFDSNINDYDYIIQARNIIEKDSIVMMTTENLIDKLYVVRDRNLFKKIKDKYPNIKIIIATNHLSFIRNYVGESFDIEYLDDLIISSEIHKTKPNTDFYEYLLNKFEIKPNELLYFDDNIENVVSAKNIGIQTVMVEDCTNIINEIDSIYKQNIQ